MTLFIAGDYDLSALFTKLSFNLFLGEDFNESF